MKNKTTPTSKENPSLWKLLINDFVPQSLLKLFNATSPAPKSRQKSWIEKGIEFMFGFLVLVILAALALILILGMWNDRSDLLNAHLLKHITKENFEFAVNLFCHLFNQRQS